MRIHLGSDWLLLLFHDNQVSFYEEWNRDVIIYCSLSHCGILHLMWLCHLLGYTWLLAMRTLPDISGRRFFLQGADSSFSDDEPSLADINKMIGSCLNLLATLSLTSSDRSSTWWDCWWQVLVLPRSTLVVECLMLGGAALCLALICCKASSVASGVDLTCRVSYSSYYPG